MSAMLRSLRIRNLALVEELEWDLPSGFTAVTGETGAGKSIILGALKFLLGERAERGVVRSGSSSAGIEAVFYLEDTVEIDSLLEESGIDICSDGELILKRTIAAEGSGRQFINGSSCNLSVLKELGSRLVDLHGPHDHQSLFSRREQTLLLDRYSNALELRESYLACRNSVAAIRRELDELELDSGGTARDEYLRTVVEEILSANLSEAEEEAIESRYRVASNSRRLIELASAASGRLDDEEAGPGTAIAESARTLRELGRLDERADSYLQTLERIAGDLDSLVSDLRGYAESIEIDAGELQMIEERINLLSSLRRKYGPSLREVIERGIEAESELKRISILAELKDSASSRHLEAVRKLEVAAALLAEKRREGAKRLADMVVKELKDLGFLHAGFQIILEPQGNPGPDGTELSDFLFAPNPGEPVQPLRAIASSGEISRVMLALKSALASQDRVPLLVFDEIDANVGGKIASRVAEKMKELGLNHQVLCITHLPQVAAAASSQFMVIKSVSRGRTETTLEPVERIARIDEIARMLGGATDSARVHAMSLLGMNEAANLGKKT